MKKIKCEKCGILITSNNYKKHYESCEKKKSRYIFIDDKWKIENNIYKCPYCEKEFSKNGISTHILRKHTHPELFVNCHKLNYINDNYVAWNKGLTKETDERVKKNVDSIKEKYLNGYVSPFKGKSHSEESKNKISEKLSKNNNGGKCKWFNYEKKNGNIVKLQGTWEVRFAKVLDVIDDDWIKIGVGHKEHSFKWKNEDREHYYTPDFYSIKLNKYFEVKGYWWGNDEEKMRQVILQNKNINIEIIKKKELELYEKLIN